MTSLNNVVEHFPAPDFHGYVARRVASPLSPGEQDPVGVHPLRSRPEALASERSLARIKVCRHAIPTFVFLGGRQAISLRCSVTSPSVR
jgi:hypothetical protein